MSNTRSKWHSITSTMPEAPTPNGKRGYVPSRDKIRQMMHESVEGGTATCFKCHVRFCMSYMRLVRSGTFSQNHACVDCVKQYQLQKV
jgi:aldehyde:ferredoxin oxidoreductase